MANKTFAFHYNNCYSTTELRCLFANTLGRHCGAVNSDRSHLFISRHLKRGSYSLICVLQKRFCRVRQSEEAQIIAGRYLIMIGQRVSESFFKNQFYLESVSALPSAKHPPLASSRPSLSSKTNFWLLHLLATLVISLGYLFAAETSTFLSRLCTARFSAECILSEFIRFCCCWICIQ